MAIIYKITNMVNGKMYIGATKKTLKNRWKEHVRHAMKLKKDFVLYRAIRKYGPNAFTIESLEEHPDTKYVFDVLEPKYISEHNTFGDGYNMTGGGEGGFGRKHSEETKRKIKTSLRIRLGPKKVKTPKPKVPHPWIGRKHSEESKEKMRQLKLGKKRPKEVVERIQKTRLEKRIKAKLGIAGAEIASA